MKNHIVILVLFCFFCVACSMGRGSSTAEGKVVDGTGKPLSGVRIIATKKEPLEEYARLETTTKPDGSFVIQGLYPSADYTLSFEAGQCAYVAQTEFISAPKGEIRTLQRKVVLKFPTLEKRSDGVVIDMRTGLEWVPTTDVLMDWHEAKQYIEGLSLDGGRWRLPTLAELKELYRTGQIGCGSREIAGDRRIWSSDFQPGSNLPGITFNFKDGSGAQTSSTNKDAFFNIGSVGVRSIR